MKNQSYLNRLVLKTIVAGVAITLAPAMAVAAPIDVPNGTFSTDPAEVFVLTNTASGYAYAFGFGTQTYSYNGATGPTTADVPDWSNASGGGGTEILGTDRVNTPNPAYSTQLYGFIQGGSITQTLAADYTADTDYALTYSAADRFDGGDPGSAFTANLYAGTTLLASASPTLVDGTFKQFTLDYDYTTDPAGTVGDALTITFTNTTVAGQALIDNVSLNTTPEPGTYALLGLGVAALLFVSRRAFLKI
jgi:hypothetical protein